MRANHLVVLGSALAMMALAATHAGTPVRAQGGAQSLPTFRSGVDLIQLDVVVLDRNRQPVSGLTAADFTVFEDGRARPLQAFAPITLPASPRADTLDASADPPGPIEFHSDVVTNQRPDEGRLVVIVLDRTIDVGGPMVEARQIGHAIVNALGPNDVAAVVRTSLTAYSGGQQNFTDDRSRLHRILDDPFMGLTSPPEMMPDGLKRPLDAGLADGGACPGGQCALETLATVAGALGHDSRRQKVIFFIGSQIAFQDSDLHADGQLSDERRRVLDNLSRANVTVHVLDPRGLQTLAKTADAFPGDASLPQRVQANLARQSGLGVLPAYTGGRAILNTNAPETQVPQLLDEGRIYYLLAFARGAASDDGRLHPIRVLVNRPDLTVRARSGYFATPASEPGAPPLDPATEATRGFLPIADLPLSLVAMPVFDDGFVRAAVGIALPLEPGPRGDALGADHFDAVVEALDDRANIVSSQGTSFGPENLKGGALQQSIRIPVKPGRYEIRVGVSSESGATGSVYGNVDVPDITHQDVALSGAVFLPVPDDVAMVPLLLVPSVTRTFDTSTPTSAFWQVFRRGGRAAHITAEVTNARNRTVARSERRLDGGEKGATLITTHRLVLPKARMPPGRYLLELTVTDGTTTDRRDVAFDVR